MVTANSLVLDESTKNFIEEKDMHEKNNQKLIGKLKSGIQYGGLKLDSYMENAENFYETQPFFYDKNKFFWFWDIQKDKWIIVDEIDIMNCLDKNLDFCGKTIYRHVKDSYIEAFKRVGRKKAPKDAPKKWIQFKNKAFSLGSKKIYTVTPEYFFTNPIPHDIGESSETPILDKLFSEWVGEEYKENLYEIIAYCCYRDYPIQIIFCLFGGGRNGKTSFLKVLNRFIGTDNICSTELNLLIDSRFESFKLFRKLICEMGETNFGTLDKSSILKKLVGSDLIGYEAKGKPPFTDYNYAKMLIASNSLPSSNDTSDGFYRRWFIIDFPNEFPEGQDITQDIPDIEFSNLAKKVTEILPKLLKEGKFFKQGSIEERRNKFILASNPLSIFLQKYYKRQEEGFVSYSETYTKYVHFLREQKKRRVKSKEFKAALEDEGYWVEKTSKKIDGEFRSGYYIEGLAQLSQLSQDDMSSKTLSQLSQLSNTPKNDNLICKSMSQLSELSQVDEKIEENDEKLSNCDNSSRFASNLPYYKRECRISHNCQNGDNDLTSENLSQLSQLELAKKDEVPLGWDNKVLVWHKCQIEGCNNTPCNFDTKGVPYCKEHFERMAD